MSAGACATTPGERIGRAVMALITGAFALGAWPNLWCAIPAGVCSLCMAVGAITGWCPTSLLQREPKEVPPNDLDIPEARAVISLGDDDRRRTRRG